MITLASGELNKNRADLLAGSWLKLLQSECEVKPSVVAIVFSVEWVIFSAIWCDASETEPLEHDNN